MADDMNQGLPSQRPEGNTQNTPNIPEQKKPDAAAGQPQINRFDSSEKKVSPQSQSQVSATQQSQVPARAPTAQSSVAPTSQPQSSQPKPVPTPQPQQPQPAAAPAAQKPSSEQPKAQSSQPASSMNKPPVPASEISKKPKKPIKRGNVIMGVVVIFLVLFVLGMILLVLMLAQNPQSNPLLELLGIEPSSLKIILSGIVNGVFGFLAFIALIFTTVGVFKIWTAPKGDAPARRRAVVMAGIGAVITFVIIFVWVILYFYISQLQVGVRVYQGIITKPAEVTQLSAPVQIVFSAADIRERYKTSKIIAYNWDFDGDGKFTEGSGEEIIYEFKDKGKNNGIYNVGVEVVFEKGKPIVVTKQVTISNILPQAEFEASPELQGFTPFEVRLDASISKDPDGNIVKYEWDFDDDGRYDAEGVKVTHVFESAGIHRVLLQVTDNNGAKATHEKVFTVEKSEKTEVIIDAKPGLTGMAPLEITFDGSRSVMPRTTINAYKWSFGDGSREESGRTVKHTFKEAGSYTVALEITGVDKRRDSSVVTVTVEAKKTTPQAVISTDLVPKDGLISGNVPLRVAFSAKKSTDQDNNIVEYRWSFADPEVINEYGEDVIHTFDKAGEFTVTLYVIDSDDNTGTATMKVVTEEPGLVGKVVANPTSGTVPLDVAFDASGSFVTNNSRIVVYRYDFGDNTPAVAGSAKQTHRYTEIGSYVAKITVVTDKGEEETLEININVLSVPLQAKFDFRPETGQAPLKVFFDANASTGNISSYSWDFGDGGISRIKNPEYTYQSSGTYTVKLEVQDISRNISNFTRQVIVE